MGKKFILLMILGILLVGFIYAFEFQTIYNPFTGKLDYHVNGNFTGENITVDNMNVLGDFNVTGNSIFNLNWTYLQNYPSACPAGTFLTQLDDSVTCTAPVADDIDPGDFPVGNYSFDTNLLFIDSTNDRIGIGTSSPDSVFHIKADIAGTVGSHPAGQLIIQNPTDTVFSNAVITGYESDGNGNPDQQLWYLGSSSGSNSNIIFLNRRNALLQFGTNGNTQMTILGNGDVGIGIVSSLLAKLHVLGNVFFDGDLNVTGNITSSNVFVPQYIFAHTNETIPLTTASVWENITFGQEVTDIKFGISHVYNDNTNHTFTINIAGVYNLEYDFDLVDTSISASDIDAAGRVIYQNGTEIVGSAFETDITKQQIETELSHSTLARLNAGDKIVFQFTADDVDVAISTHGTFGDHPDSATIIIEKIANL